MTWLDEVRRRIRLIHSKVYLNNASSGPPPDNLVSRVCEVIHESAEIGEPWDIFLDTVVELKKRFAAFIGAEYDEISYIPGVTYGLQTLLASLDFNRNSNIVISELNFPTSIVMAYAMKRNGLVGEVRMVKDRGGYTDFNDYEKYIDDNTALVMVDYVPWLTGYLEDVKGIADLAHRHGAFMVSDMFHAIGVYPVDVKKLDVDAVVTGSYKWLMSLHGAGLMYVRKDYIERLKPKYTGWLAIEDSVFQRRARGEDEFRRPFKLVDFEYPDTASRFELGTPPIIPVIALYESLKFLMEYDAPGRFDGYTGRNADYLIDRLSDLGYQVVTPRDRHASIVTFRHENPHETAAKLLEKNIEVSARPGLIRVSPHFYNTKDELDTLVDTLKEIDGR